MQPEEKIEFSSLMYEIKVLPLNYSGGENTLVWTENLLCHIQSLYLLSYIILKKLYFYKIIKISSKRWFEHLNINTKNLWLYPFVYFESMDNKTWTCMVFKPLRPKRSLSTFPTYPLIKNYAQSKIRTYN